MKHFLKNIQNTFYNREFYHTVFNEADISKAIIFYLKIWAAIAILILIIGIPTVLYTTKNLSPEIIKTISASYPDGFTVSYDHGEISTSTSPQTISFKTDSNHASDFVIVFDTQNDRVAQELYPNATMLVGKKYITGVKSRTENGPMEVREYNISQFKDSSSFSLTKEMILQYIPTIARIIQAAILLGVILFAIFAPVFKIIGIFLWSVTLAALFWLIYIVQKKQGTFKNFYTVALYASFPALTIVTVLSLLGIDFMFSGTFVALFTFLLNFLSKKSHI